MLSPVLQNSKFKRNTIINNNLICSFFAAAIEKKTLITTLVYLQVQCVPVILKMELQWENYD